MGQGNSKEKFKDEKSKEKGVNKKIWSNYKKREKVIPESASFTVFKKNKPRGGLFEKTNYKPGSIFYSVSGDERLWKSDHPFLEGIYLGWLQHCPLVLSPDMFWMIIVQAFSRHIYLNAEKLRYNFVNFDGKKDLTVDIGKLHYENITEDDWENFLAQIVNNIKGYTGEELIDTMNFDFSTTDKILMYSGKVCIMSAMQKYFNYIMGYGGCGFPKITLEGTLEDWEKLLKKTEKLEYYNFSDYVFKIRPSLEKIVETKKYLNENANEKIDIKFWKEMIYNKSHIETEGMGSVFNPLKLISLEKHTDIYGWILDFFIFKKGGEKVSYSYEKSCLKNGSIYELATETICTPFTFNCISDKARYFNIYVGFMGVSQNEETYEIKPDLGYYVIEEGHNSDKKMFE